jgi:hypothetical protein
VLHEPYIQQSHQSTSYYAMRSSRRHRFSHLPVDKFVTYAVLRQVPKVLGAHQVWCNKTHVCLLFIALARAYVSTIPDICTSDPCYNRVQRNHGLQATMENDTGSGDSVKWAGGSWLAVRFIGECNGG